MERPSKYIPTAGLSREEWLDKRREGIGGSDVAAICGISRYKTPLQVYNEKLSYMNFTPNEPMYWGNKLEDLVAERWMEETGRKVMRDNKIRIHKDIPYLFANIDRIINTGATVQGDLPYDNGILEVKTAGVFAYKYWESEPPVEYVMQIQHYLDVTGYTWGEFAVLIGGQEFKRFRIERDDNLIKTKNEFLIKFWEENVLKQIPPEPINREDILALYSQTENGKAVQADKEMISLYERLKICKDAKKKLEDEEEELKNYFLMKMKDAEVLMNENEKLLTYKTQSMTRLDTAKLKKECPEIFKQYPAISQSRVLRIY